MLRTGEGPRTLTAAQEDRVIDEYLSGKSMRVVADEIGTTKAVVKGCLHRRNIPRRASNDYRCVPKEMVQEMIERYESGESAAGIASDFGVSQTTVYGYLRKAGVPVRNPQLLNRATPEQERKAIQLYQQGLTLKQVATELEVNASLALRILTRHNIPRRSSHDYDENHSFDEHFFDQIDCEEKAYMLGFLYADGCLLQDKNFTIRLNLHEKDRAVLEEFRKILKSTYKLYRFKTLNQWCLQVPSEHMWRRLVELGCPPRKTFRLKYPTWMPRTLENHFIRGYFDGDGTIGFYKTTRSGKPMKTPKVAASLLGTPSMCDGIADALERETGNRPTIYIEYSQNGVICKLGVGGPRKTIEMMKYLYRDATIYMKRKYAVYEQVQTYCDLVDKNAKSRSICMKCGGKALARNLCRKHYVEWKRTRTDRPACTMEMCEKVAYSRGLCEYHYNRWRFEGSDRPRCVQCDKPAVAMGRCQRHYKELKGRGK